MDVVIVSKITIKGIKTTRFIVADSPNKVYSYVVVKSFITDIYFN